jgi:hypothetical protein
VEEPISQDNADCYIGCDTLGELSYPTLDILDEDDEREKQKQDQKVGQEEQRERSSNK